MSQTDSLETASPAPYRVLARKYRPRSFDDLIGQEPMVRTLTNAFESGRIAQAWMLTGVRGVGKTTTARILARALNYETDTVHRPTIRMTEPGVHDAAIMEGRHVDVVEMDAASHTGIDDIREIIQQVRYRPVSARFKVYIIDEVHMLSTQAFNGLLKTLEEPPEHAKFVFATTEIRKVPVTILSRCQRFDLRRIEAGALMGHLARVLAAEGVEAESEALRVIARAAEGSARDALSLTDQAIAHGAGAVTAAAVRDMLGLADRIRVIDLFEHLMRGDGRAALSEFAEQYAAGADPVAVLTDLAQFTHLVTQLRFVPDSGDDATLSPAEAERGRAFAGVLSVRALGQAWQMLLKAIEETRAASTPREAAEMALIRIAYAADLPSPDELLRLLAKGDALPTLSAPPAPSLTDPSRAPVQSAPPAAAASAPPQAPPTAPVMAEPQPAQAAPQPAQTLPQPAPQSSSVERPSPAAHREPDSSAQDHPNQASAGQAPANPAPAGQAPASQPPTSQAPAGQTAPAKAPPPLRAPLGLVPASVEPSPRAQTAHPAADGPSPASLADLDALAKHKRDSRMRIWIRRYLRLAHIEPGRLDVVLAGDAPSALPNELARRLLEWTGRRWVVSLASTGGGATLEEEETARRERLRAEAEADPEVAAVLAAFPGASIREVRLRGEPEAVPPAPVEEEIVSDDDLPAQIDADPGDFDLGLEGVDTDMRDDDEL